MAVTELVEGDSSRKIVEIICRTSWLKSENHCGRIERVLKVHNMQRTLARFEEYREMVKVKASKLPKKHPRCIADGNELLRFYGTTVACSLGLNGSSSLCISEKCCVCRIIRNGFSAKKELKEGIGVFTTSTSGRAFESIQILEDNPSLRKALIVCRVIAGRVHRPLENIQEMAGQTGFDSLAGKVGLYSNIEELYLLNPRALLPCFVVICKPWGKMLNLEVICLWSYVNPFPFLICRGFLSFILEEFSFFFYLLIHLVCSPHHLNFSCNYILLFPCLRIVL